MLSVPPCSRSEWLCGEHKLVLWKGTGTKTSTLTSLQEAWLTGRPASYMVAARPGEEQERVLLF